MSRDCSKSFFRRSGNVYILYSNTNTEESIYHAAVRPTTTNHVYLPLPAALPWHCPVRAPETVQEVPSLWPQMQIMKTVLRVFLRCGLKTWPI